MPATDANAPAERSPRGAAAAATLWWLLHAALGGLLLAAMLAIVPRFAATFADFDFTLPAATVVAVRASRIAVGGVYLVIPGAVVALLIDWAAMYQLHVRGRPLAAALWAASWALLLLAASGMAAMAVILPMLRLVESLA